MIFFFLFSTFYAYILINYNVNNCFPKFKAFKIIRKGVQLCPTTFEGGVQICPIGLNPIFISVDHDQYQAAGQMHNFTKL